jgi:hypothetical protein
MDDGQSSTKYTILIADYIDDLEGQIASAISEGWEPLGSLSCSLVDAEEPDNCRDAPVYVCSQTVARFD